MSEPAVKLENVSFTYAGRNAPTLKSIDLTVPKGQFVLLTGPTGCGKSTLLKLLNGIIPHASSGSLTGRVFISGCHTLEYSIAELSELAGLVFQSPDEQIFTTVVEDETAFGPENLAVPAAEITERITESLAAVGMSEFSKAKTNDLSGGQKQRVVIAAVKAMKSHILVLDEPVSQLDPSGAHEVLQTIESMKQQWGLTIILVEHRIHEVVHFADRLIIMDKGEIVLDEPVREALKNSGLFLKYGLRLPQLADIAYRLNLPAALSVDELAAAISEKRLSVRPKINYNLPEKSSRRIVEAVQVFAGYQKNKAPVLQGVSFYFNQGEIVALMGNNGAGKSTLLKNLIGILKPCAGKLTVLGEESGSFDPLSLAGKVGLVLQNPDLMLFCESVEKEILFGLNNLKFPLAVKKERLRKIMSEMKLEELKNDFPLALSRGQRLRVAVASVLALEPQLLLLDEPTTGQDKQHIEAMMQSLQSYVQEGGTLFFCTHDGETALEYADRLIIMHNGQVLANGRPEALFGDAALLHKAGLKAPPALLLSQKLGVEPIYMPREVERWTLE